MSYTNLSSQCSWHTIFTQTSDNRKSQPWFLSLCSQRANISIEPMPVSEWGCFYMDSYPCNVYRFTNQRCFAFTITRNWMSLLVTAVVKEISIQAWKPFIMLGRLLNSSEDWRRRFFIFWYDELFIHGSTLCAFVVQWSCQIPNVRPKKRDQKNTLITVYNLIDGCSNQSVRGQK